VQSQSDCKHVHARARQAYAYESDQGQIDKRVIDFLPLVRHVAQKVVSHAASGIEMDDIISAGTVGLVKAARNFDPSRHADFKTYAYIRVRGAILDELRQRSFVPVAVHKRIRDIRKAYQELKGPSGQEPSDEQLAKKLGITLEQLYKTLQSARTRHFLSIHGLSGDPPALEPLLPVSGDPTPDQVAERRELLGRLAEAITELPDRDRTVLLLYYERDLTMKEAAQVLEVTESRVSQIHASAIFKLSMKLKGSV